jgi:DNA-directed RNA polymerase subunit RPC12/RpoP
VKVLSRVFRGKFTAGLKRVLPHGFVRIRFFGFLANRRRKSLLPLSRQLLQMLTPGSPDSVQPKVSSRQLWRCPRCGSSMLLMQRFTVAELKSQSLERRICFDSS